MAETGMRLQAPALGCDAYLLQALVWPDRELHPDLRLTLRLTEGARLGDDHSSVDLAPGAQLGLDTAYNLFPWTKWHRHCGLRQLSVAVAGQGNLAFVLTAETCASGLPVQTRRLDLTLVEGEAQTLDLSDWLDRVGACMLHLRFEAMGPARITGVDWRTTQAPLRLPKLMLCITTFRREAAAASTALRFDRFMDQSDLAQHLHLLMVDNGQTLVLPPLAHVTLVQNPNLGGSGGFARGLHEAIARGRTHCLFMDDDAAVDMASITRTWRFLAYATDPSVAIAGALMRADKGTLVWENCATFVGVCRSRSRDKDLTQLADVLDVERTSLPPQPDNLYGGFWYFAFAIEAVRYWTFPFFVRGDDISFSIMNGFDIVTLPGVMSFQDLDFSDKETSLTIYLDCRCDMVQNLTVPKMPKRLWRTVRSAMAFFARSMIQSHHDSLHAINMACEDVMRGPDFFAANVDLAQRRAELATLRRREVWRALDGPLPAERRRINPDSPWQHLVMKLTFNGLFLPFFGQWGNHIVKRQNERQNIIPCWGAARISYISNDGSKIMEVRHQKLSTWIEGLRLVGNLVRLVWTYRRLRQQWAEGYGTYAAASFWDRQFEAKAQADGPTTDGQAQGIN